MITLEYAFLLLGYALAIWLAYGLGRIFYIPIILDLTLDLSLYFDLLSGWDIRWLMTTAWGLFFVWALALSKGFKKVWPLALVAIDLAFVYQAIIPQLEMAGTGQPFWNATCTSIMQVWDLSTTLLVGSTIFMSTVWPKLRGEFVDVLTNPRKRFLIPMGLYSGYNFFHVTFANVIPPWMHEYGWRIASQVLVWGWVAFELPFFIMYRRLRRQHS